MIYATAAAPKQKKYIRKQIIWIIIGLLLSPARCYSYDYHKDPMLTNILFGVFAGLFCVACERLISKDLTKCGMYGSASLVILGGAIITRPTEKVETAPTSTSPLATPPVQAPQKSDLENLQEYVKKLERRYRPTLRLFDAHKNNQSDLQKNLHTGLMRRLPIS